MKCITERAIIKDYRTDRMSTDESAMITDQIDRIMKVGKYAPGKVQSIQVTSTPKHNNVAPVKPKMVKPEIPVLKFGKRASDIPLRQDPEAMLRFKSKLQCVPLPVKKFRVTATYTTRDLLSGRVYEIGRSYYINGRHHRLYFGIEKTVDNAELSSIVMCLMINDEIKLRQAEDYELPRGMN